MMKGWTQEDLDRLTLSKSKPAKPERKPRRKPRIGKGAQQPNATEQEYADRFLRSTDHRHQALTFHMKNGCSYTADWIVFTDGVPEIAIECKGSYRFHSHGRAQLAFRQCREEFAGIKFMWATKTNEGWVHDE